MKWDKDKSIKLSKLCIIIFLVLLVVAVMAGPRIIKMFWYPLFYNIDVRFVKDLIILYGAPAVIALLGLYKLLDNIRKDMVFTRQNILIMRLLSWMCFIVCILSLIFMFKQVTLFVLAVASFMMGMLLRVVKNVFVRALEIKTENDFTI